MIDIDDDTAAYIIEHRKHFEDLRQVAAQLAGLLVLAASEARSATPDHPMLDMAEELFGEAVDGVRHARPTARAQRHHDHLLRAATSLGMALSEARERFARPASAAGAIEAVLSPLSSGYVHLQDAAAALPGFELVAFGQGCCGNHMKRSGVGDAARP